MSASTSLPPECGSAMKVTRHDLMTPLHQIIGYSEMLAEDAASAGQASQVVDLERITQAARHATVLVDALFQTAGVDAPATVEAGAASRAAEVRVGMTACLSGLTLALPAGSATPEPRLAGRVLIVDDNEVNRQMLCRRLERQGHSTESADSGAAGLAKLRAAAFDLVLLDVMMPEMDGYVVLQRIKADPGLRHLPVIMISAQHELDNVVRCIELGAEDYLPKPFDPTLLKARVTASLEKKRLREQEQAYREESLRAEADLERHRALAQMVAGVAHEINTPLGIASTAQSVIERCLSSGEVQALFAGSPQLAETRADIQEGLTLLKNNVVRAHRLVETFKKVSVSQITENLERVDLPALVRDCIELFGIGARQARLVVTIDTAGLRGDPVWFGYPGCFTQVMMNLLQNIDRYAYPGGIGGAVEITIADQEVEGAEVFTVAVCDHGKGIAPGDLPRIFEPFFTTGRGAGGTGLGLAIVNNIVATMLKGQIAVVSGPGQGSIFTLILPKLVNASGSTGSAVGS